MRGTASAGNVTVLLGGACIVIASIIGFGLARADSLTCVSGPLAQGPAGTSWLDSRMMNFERVSDAEAFACVEVPEMHAEGWDLTGAYGERTRDVAALLRGLGTSHVWTGYTNASLKGEIQIVGRSLDISNWIPPDAQPMKLGEREILYYRGGIDTDSVGLFWREGDTDVVVGAELTSTFTLDDFLRAASTIR